MLLQVAISISMRTKALKNVKFTSRMVLQPGKKNQKSVYICLLMAKNPERSRIHKEPSKCDHFLPIQIIHPKPFRTFLSCHKHNLCYSRRIQKV